MTTAVHHRVSVPLTKKDVEAVARLRAHLAQARPASNLIARGDISESALLHEVLAAGLAALEAQIREAGYAEMAEQYQETAEGRERKALRQPLARFAEN